MKKIDIYVYGKQPQHKSCDTDALIVKSLGYYSEKHGIGFDENTEVLRDGGGKPHFRNGAPQIGVTHTDELIFIAFDRDNFGIDAEKDTRTVKRSAEITKKYMTQSERAYIDKAADRNAAFLETWVKKEAYVKYTGAGLRGISGFAFHAYNTRITLYTSVRKNLRKTQRYTIYGVIECQRCCLR